MSLPRCPACRGEELPLFLTEAEVAGELEARERFFLERLDRDLPAAQLRDITDVALGTPAPIVRCARCGTLIRESDEASFREDVYDPRALEAIHQSHVAAFRRKKAQFDGLLEPGARVIEIGSYVGGFAQIAAEIRWRIAAVDIGPETARFTRSLGIPTLETSFEEGPFDEDSIDGVFVWNCFEQLSSPRRTVAAIARTLRRHGLLIVRVPDARLYAAHSSLRILAYNGFLGWPHRFGYDIPALRRLCEASDLRFVSARRSRAMRPHRASMHRWAQAEEIAAMSDPAARGWLEVTFEKAA